MSTPIKDNMYILSNPQAFQEAYSRARNVLGQIEGVVGVGFGQKQTHEQYNNDIAIVVFVREKKKEEELPPEQRIPSSFEGYRTDVRLVRRAGFHTCDNNATYDRIQGGIQIMPPRNPATGNLTGGTLGCIVRRRNDSGRENVYLLTNKHVLFKAWVKAGDYVYHPFSPGTPEVGDSNALGPINAQPFYRNVSFAVPDAAGVFDFEDYFIDCAIARIDLDSRCCGSTCTKDTTKYEPESIIDLQLNGVNTIADVRSVINDSLIIHTKENPRKVFKVGRTTGRTVGLVRLINAAIDVPPDEAVPGATNFTAYNTIEIDFDTSSTRDGVNCKGNARFTEHGDSGSVVLDEQGRVIGLFSMGDLPDSPSTFPSNACHIMPILDNLNICIPTTSGTSRGSCRATDGSGVAPAPRVSELELPEGQIVFTSQEFEPVVARSANLTAPVAVTDEEVHHMSELLDTFRQTEKGRELHQVFAEVRREIGYLVRNCRPVKVAWHRNKGPAFFAHVLNHLKGNTDGVPQEVESITREILLTRMGDVLTKYGSNPLRRAIEQHRDDLMQMLADGNCISAQDCIDYLQQRELQQRKLL